jgi:hypothetical protein
MTTRTNKIGKDPTRQHHPRWTDEFNYFRRFRMSGTSVVKIKTLKLRYILGLKTLGTGYNFKLNIISFVERLEAFTLNGAVMYKNVITGIAADETITFFVVKPLDGALFFHLSS